MLNPVTWPLIHPPSKRDPREVLSQLLPDSTIEERMDFTMQAGKERVPFSGLSSHLNLGVFQTHPDKIPAIVDLFDLHRAISECRYTFYKHIEKVDRSVLELVPLLELQLAPIIKNFEILNYVLMPDEELYNTTFTDYRFLSQQTKKVVKKRLSHIEKNCIPIKNLRLNSIGMLRQLKKGELGKALPHLPEDSLDLISKAQIEEGIDCSLLIAEKLERLVKTQSKLFKTASTINAVVQGIRTPFLRLIPIDWIPQIRMNQLPDKKLECLLLVDKENRFHLLDDEQINDVAKKLNLHSLRHIPRNHLPRIRIGDFDAFRIPLLWPLNNDQTIQIFSSYPASEINKALPNLSEDYMHHLSLEQLKGLDTTKCEEKHIRGLFASKYAHTRWGWEIIKKLKVLSDEQIRGFKQLTKEQREILNCVKSKDGVEGDAGGASPPAHIALLARASQE